MYCRNEFCVYWNKNNCTKGEIELDRRGTCLNCIYIMFDTGHVEEERKRSRALVEECDAGGKRILEAASR